ncbi:hypothetical protein EDB69_2768 [Vibrio crassostreae]|nr:hypothetical protein EDB64_1489 [Vibrio crassostreae]ROP10803.1 hypothetical protein EDB63_2524 [Vibrio crassostreae]ROP15678.1 hypothetical protein EDB33_111164 [Vibrio crassostreae]ROP20654.1 hypothetical protein EDB34_11112 [Vibrio crassostreae]ROQ80471.1 hypothetical protein EDB72_3175 [Vibrio crassostreae]
MLLSRNELASSFLIYWSRFGLILAMLKSMHKTHRLNHKRSFDTYPTRHYDARLLTTLSACKHLMFSQSLFAQLARMTLFLVISLVIVHHSQPLIDLLAQHAVSSGCHQQSAHGHSGHEHHHDMTDQHMSAQNHSHHHH